jgi:predicted neuraminidase
VSSLKPEFTLTRKEAVFSEAAPPTTSCHGSTLVSLPSGVGCAWFGGAFEGSRDTRIWWSFRSQDGWTTPDCVADVSRMPHWNPVLHAGTQGIHLFFKVGIYPKRWQTYVTSRSFDGEDWSRPRELVPGDVGGRGPVKNKILRLRTGEWLAPASLERDEGWDCFVDRSVDEGVTWQAGELVPVDREALAGPGIIQPSLWTSSPGHVHMLARSSDGHVYRADSEDDGRTWACAYPIHVPNNNCGLDVLRLKSGALVLVCNPVNESWGPRTPLTLFLSHNNGHVWEEAAVLEDDEGEYSYPAVVSIPGGFGVSYTWKRERIEYCAFEADRAVSSIKDQDRTPNSP